MNIRIIISVIIIAQLMTACCKESIYEITITGIESSAWLSEGLNLVEFEKQNAIDKDKFVIGIDFTIRQDIVSNEPVNNEGIKVLRAAVVPCSDQVLVYKSSIESIKVEILDINNDNEKADITNQMVILDSQMSLSEYISQNPQGIGGFFIQPSDTTNIPDRIEYIIEIMLDDGTKMSAKDGIINFN